MQLLFSTDSSRCAAALQARLTAELSAGKRVLWFMTGGSNIAVDIAVMAQLPADLTKNLTVTLTDERFGNYGHADSNWQQLQSAGLDVKQAQAYPVLQESNLDLPATTRLYATTIEAALASADVVIGFYGLGSDGHIAGILPNTPAVHAGGAATSYQTETFTRITTTFETIRHCQTAYMFAGGSSKVQPLEQLRQDVPLTEQPAQILKQLPEAYIYNDHIGDKS